MLQLVIPEESKARFKELHEAAVREAAPKERMPDSDTALTKLHNHIFYLYSRRHQLILEDEEVGVLGQKLLDSGYRVTLVEFYIFFGVSRPTAEKIIELILGKDD